MATVDDGTLWRRAQEGDETAFGVLFERYAASIHSYCFRRTGDWALAEDLTSVTFLECWRHRSRVRLDAGEVLPWLYGVARNVTRNSARSRRRYASALARIPCESGEADFAERVAERVSSERRVRDLLSSLEELPPRELDAVVLVCWQGLSHAEAAFALEVPEATVRSRLFRARRRLARAGEAESEAESCHRDVALQDEGGPR